MRILAVDPGEKRIGIAVSDPSGTIANPLTVLKHVSRPIDAAAIASIAHEQEAGLIVVGEALDDEGEPTMQSRRASRLAEAIKRQTSVKVVMWDESGSTQAAQQARIAIGSSRKKRRGHQDDLAATYILQTYLDAHDQTKEKI
ncbi:MAG: Holliday junction resolvase RuvX [Chloroflexi bacterium]|nr:MAG: Holliday junction resolvase RuvX [Chloroflexota bacterium]